MHTLKKCKRCSILLKELPKNGLNIFHLFLSDIMICKYKFQEHIFLGTNNSNGCKKVLNSFANVIYIPFVNYTILQCYFNYIIFIY